MFRCLPNIRGVVAQKTATAEVTPAVAVEILSGCLDLEDVQDEVMSAVVRLFRWIEVIPRTVVDRDPHRGLVAVIHVVILLRPLEILRIIDVWIIVKSLPV
jgi:hypothetical protein